MIAEQITWEQFTTYNIEARGIRYKFEDLCRQLFTNEFLSQNQINKYVHSNPNNPGIESEPILNESNNRYIGYQAKFFDGNPGYSQIEESARKAVTHYKGQLDCIYLFCNKPLTTTCDSYRKIEKILSDVGIDLVPITDSTILDLVRKYPALGKYYFGNHNINHDWFVNQANVSANILGERYNQEFNVDTEAAKNLSVFLHDTESIEYFNGKKKKLLDDILSLRWELGKYYDYARNLREFIETIPDVNFDTIYDVEGWQDTVFRKFSQDINDIKSQIDKFQESLEKIQNKDREKAGEYRRELDRLTIIQELYSQLNISSLEKTLLHRKILVVEGKPGIGKTQLFANKAFTILNDDENAMLVIGGDCLSDNNIIEQLRSNLRLNFDFEDLIDILNVIGESKRRIIPIFIDALNESWKPQLWKSALSIIYNKICEKKYVRLAISFRNEYEKTIIPDRFLELDNVVKIEHQGFRANSLEAAKKFLAFYGLPFTPIHMFTSNIDNPLFLTLYCKTYQGDDVSLPILYDRLLEKANEKIYTVLESSIRAAGYDSSDNLVDIIVEAISKEILSTGKRYFEKNEIANLPVWESIGLASRPFIKHLMQENILHGYESEGKDYLYFAYDQMNDYYPAKAIVSMYSSERELRSYLADNILGIDKGEIKNWGNEDLFVNACALYADKFHTECIDVIDLISDEFDRESIFRTYLESFEWRTEIFMPIEVLLENCNKYDLEPDILWKVFITNSVKVHHLLNADSLHTVLMKYPISDRDFLWTEYINGRTSDDDRVVQLVELYNNGGLLQITNKEQVRLLLILFAWMLTSSNRWIRDTTSKAMVEILKEYFEYSEYLLNQFSTVNDSYIVQRLYGIVFGACVKRTTENKKIYGSLVAFVYDNIFNKDIVYPDILLRDYARLIIERFIYEYPCETLTIDLDKIKPPYKSIPIPEIEDQKYSDQKFDGGEFYILYSMRFEEMGMYGDFGRYVFQSALKNFDVDNYKIFNYAMYYIFNELGYKNEIFDSYDKFVSRFGYDRHRTLKTERIGKKYQWITMYNILARVSDYCPMRNSYSMDEEVAVYDGPWEPYVKDFDPTLNDNFLIDNNAPMFMQISEHLQAAIQENNSMKKDSNFDETVWTKSESIFFEYQKNDLMLIDQEGEQWVTLTKYVDTGKYDLAHDKLLVWNWLYGYFVSEEQLSVIKKYFAQKGSFLCNDITHIPETYVLYNREYPWSSGSRVISEWQYSDVELPTAEKRTVTVTVEEPDFSELDKILSGYLNQDDDSEDINNQELNSEANEEINIPVIPKTYTREENITIPLERILNAAQSLVWEGEFDASKKDSLSYFHPCAELIETLGLRQKRYDGYYYDEKDSLIAFDSDLNKQKAGLVIRKSALDKFISLKKLHLVWFINASKEIHDQTLMITNYTDWTGLLEYTGESVSGDYYIEEKKR